MSVHKSPHLPSSETLRLKKICNTLHLNQKIQNNVLFVNEYLNRKQQWNTISKRFMKGFSLNWLLVAQFAT